MELPLPRSLAPQLARLAEMALAVADEGDLPMLVRTLLKVCMGTRRMVCGI